MRRREEGKKGGGGGGGEEEEEERKKRRRKINFAKTFVVCSGGEIVDCQSGDTDHRNFFLFFLSHVR